MHPAPVPAATTGLDSIKGKKPLEFEFDAYNYFTVVENFVSLLVIELC